MKKRTSSIRKKLREETKKCKTKCALCGKKYDFIGVRPTADHVVPKSSNGKTILSNLIVICQKCNSVSKKSLSLKEFIKLNPKCKHHLYRYLYKCKKIYINGKSYYNSIIWIKQYL